MFPRAIGTEQVVCSIPGRIGYRPIISYPMFIEPTWTWVPSEFFWYTWLDTKIVLKIFYYSGTSGTRSLNPDSTRNSSSVINFFFQT